VNCEPSAPDRPRSSLDDAIDAYRPGIDVSLPREDLRRTPEERLLRLMELIRFRARDRIDPARGAYAPGAGSAGHGTTEPEPRASAAGCRARNEEDGVFLTR
jgi:hypothetical protein